MLRSANRVGDDTRASGLHQSSSRNAFASLAGNFPASISFTSSSPSLILLTIFSSAVTGVSLNAPRREVRRTDSPCSARRSVAVWLVLNLLKDMTCMAYCFLLVTKVAICTKTATKLRYFNTQARLSFIIHRFLGLFPFCSRIKAVSTPIYPPSSSHWHWRKKTDKREGWLYCCLSWLLCGGVCKGRRLFFGGGGCFCRLGAGLCRWGSYFAVCEN